MGERYRLAHVAVLLMIVVGVSVDPVTAATQGGEEWLEMETETFVVEYKDGYEDDASKVADMSENAYTELRETFPENVSEPSFEQPIHIRVYPERMWSRPDYTLSWKDTTPVRIHVKAPSDSKTSDNWYEHGLAHELANMFLWNEAGQYDNYNYYQRNPSWFPEGLTEYYIYNTPTVEDQYPPRGVERLKETIAAGNGDFSSLTSKQYDGGHILAMYLIDEYGEDAVWSLLRNDASSWDDAVQDELNVTQSGLERNWYRWAEENIGGDYSDRIASFEPKVALERAEAENEQLKEELDRKTGNRVFVFGAGFGVGVVFVSLIIALYFMKRRLDDNEMQN